MVTYVLINVFKRFIFYYLNNMWLKLFIHNFLRTYYSRLLSPSNKLYIMQKTHSFISQVFAPSVRDKNACENDVFLKRRYFK